MNSRRGIAVAATVALAALIEARGARAASRFAGSTICYCDALASGFCCAMRARRSLGASLKSANKRLDGTPRAGSEHRPSISSAGRRVTGFPHERRPVARHR